MADPSQQNPPPSPWASPGFGSGAEPHAPGAADPADPGGAPSPYQSSGAPGTQAPSTIFPATAGNPLTGEVRDGVYTFPALTKPALDPLAPLSLVASPVSPLGLGLGIASLRRIRRRRLRGRGMAIGGIILSSLFLIASLLVVATFALDGTFARLTETPVAGDVSSTRTVSPVNLDVGNCVVTLPVTSTVGEVTLAPCAEGHQLQVIDRIAVTGDAYPGADSLFTNAEESCGAVFERLGSDGYAPHFLVPSQENWNDQERNIICFARSTAGPVTTDLLAG